MRSLPIARHSFACLPLLAGLSFSPPPAAPQHRRDNFSVSCEELLKDQATGTCIAASSTPTLGWLYPLTTDLNVSAAGKVGIGTTTPSGKLDVAGQTNFTQSASTYTSKIDNTTTTGIRDGLRVNVYSGSGYGVWVQNNSGTGTSYSVRAQSDSPTARSCFGEATTTGASVAYGVYGEVHNTSAFGVYSNGDFGGTGAKFFIQPHPTDPSKQVNFACLEGNESGTYFRGSANVQGGVATVAVPESFRLVTEEGSVTATATAVGAPANVWIESQSLDAIVVRANADVTVNYMVTGTRRGFAGLETIRENTSFVPEYRGIPFGLQYRPEYRQLLVQSGVLNADFTPNEATARQLGWSLADPWEDEHAEPILREYIRAGRVVAPPGWIPPSER